MQYKTIVLELIKERPEMYEELRRQRQLLPTVEAYAIAFRECHLACQKILSQARPGSDPSQIASEALEIALKELEASLPPDSPPDEDTPLTLDAAMAFLHRHHTPPA
jgi:hypothetical protein